MAQKYRTLLIYFFSIFFACTLTSCGNLLVSNPEGGSNFAPGLVQPTPTLTRIFPPGGLSSGGNSINIYGSNFTSSTLVTINGITCSSTALISATQLLCNVPGYALGSTSLGRVDVAAANLNSAQAVLPQSYTYLGSPSLWLDASQLSSSTSSVSLWPDLSGNNISPTAVITAPTYKSNAFPNGLPSVAFNGSQCLGSNSGFPLTSDFTVSIIVKQTSAVNYGNVFSDGLNGQHALYFNNSNFPQLFRAGSSYCTSIAPTVLSSFSTLTVNRAGLTPWAASIYINGQLGNTGNDTGNNTSPQFQVGCYGNSSNLTGEIAEIILYGTQILSSAQRTILESYLRNKYAHY